MKDINRLIEDIVRDRRTLNEFYNIKATQPHPASPASDKDLAALKEHLQHLGLPLPLSYQSFLAESNGIKGFHPFLDLLSAKQVMEHADKTIDSDFPSLSQFVIARGETSAFISFDSDTANETGEMEIVWVTDDGEQIRYPNFDAFLHTLRDVLQGHVKREQDDRYNLPD